MLKPGKILIIQTDNLQELILSLPVIEALAHYRPDSEIHVLTSSAGVSLIEDHPRVSHTWIWPETGKDTLKQKLTCIKRLQARHFDLSLNLSNLRFPVERLMNIPRRLKPANPQQPERGFAGDIRQPLFQHRTHYFLSALLPLGIRHPETTPKLYSNPITQAKIKSLLQENPQSYSPRILFHLPQNTETIPGLDTNLDTLIKTLSKERQRIVLITPPQCSSTLKNLTSFKEITCLSQPFPPHELLEFIAISDFLVTADPVSMQIASCTNKPLLYINLNAMEPPSIYGPDCDYFKLIDAGKTPLQSQSDHLQNTFFQLQSEIALSQRLSSNSRIRYRLLESLHIGYWIRNTTHYYDSLSTLKKLRKQGLQIFTYHFNRRKPLSSLLRLRQLIKNKHISILQGKWIPGWIKSFLPNHIKQVNLDFHQYISLSDYLKIYEKP